MLLGTARGRTCSSRNVCFYRIVFDSVGVTQTSRESDVEKLNRMFQQCDHFHLKSFRSAP